MTPRRGGVGGATDYRLQTTDYRPQTTDIRPEGGDVEQKEAKVAKGVWEIPAEDSRDWGLDSIPEVWQRRLRRCGIVFLVIFASFCLNDWRTW
jgi:hypothetical protein